MRGCRCAKRVGSQASSSLAIRLLLLKRLAPGPVRCGRRSPLRPLIRGLSHKRPLSMHWTFFYAVVCDGMAV